MTIDQFCERVSMLGCEWHLDEDGNITSADEYCPIDEVWLDENDDLHEGGYMVEGELLGLPAKAASCIAAAADNRGYPRIRARLLLACGIETMPTGASP